MFVFEIIIKPSFCPPFAVKIFVRVRANPFRDAHNLKNTELSNILGISNTCATTIQNITEHYRTLHQTPPDNTFWYHLTPNAIYEIIYIQSEFI